jgi:hypothetical protein
VKSKKEALKLLPSLFEEFLPQGEYRYDGYFQDDLFFGFAYNKQQITELLVAKRVDLAKINSVSFAQSVFLEKDLPCVIDKERVLYLQNGIVIVAPALLAPDAKKMQLQNVELGKHTLYFESFNNPIDAKVLYFISGIFAVFALFNFIEWGITEHKANVLETKKQELFSQYGLLPTMFQNKSLLKRYEAIDAQQKKLRKLFADLFGLHVPQKVKLKMLQKKAKKVVVTFSGVQEGTLFFKQLQKLGSVAILGNETRVEVVL